MEITFAILTISDRSAQGIREDASGPALISFLQKQENFLVYATQVIPDDFDQIRTCLLNWCNQVDVILTTGGTGFSPRDITPEATSSVVQRNAPGLAEMMRTENVKKTPHAILSRSVAGIRDSTIIINLPGNPKAAVENLESIISVLPHAVKLLRGDASRESDHTFIVRAPSL